MKLGLNVNITVLETHSRLPSARFYQWRLLATGITSGQSSERCNTNVRGTLTGNQRWAISWDIGLIPLRHLGTIASAGGQRSLRLQVWRNWLAWLPEAPFIGEQLAPAALLPGSLRSMFACTYGLEIALPYLTLPCNQNYFRFSRSCENLVEISK